MKNLDLRMPTFTYVKPVGVSRTSSMGSPNWSRLFGPVNFTFEFINGLRNSVCITERSGYIFHVPSKYNDVYFTQDFRDKFIIRKIYNYQSVGASGLHQYMINAFHNEAGQVEKRTDEVNELSSLYGQASFIYRNNDVVHGELDQFKASVDFTVFESDLKDGSIYIPNLDLCVQIGNDVTKIQGHPYNTITYTKEKSYELLQEVDDAACAVIMRVIDNNGDQCNYYARSDKGVVKLRSTRSDALHDGYYRQIREDGILRDPEIIPLQEALKLKILFRSEEEAKNGTDPELVLKNRQMELRMEELRKTHQAKIDELEKKIQLDKQTYEKTINKLKLEEEQLQRKDTYEQRKNEYEDRKFWRKETIEIIGLGLAALGSIATAYALYRKNQS